MKGKPRKRVYRSYPVEYERDEDGWWVATVPGLPGCHTQGRTLEQARERIAEAIALHVDDKRARKAGQLGALLASENIKLKPDVRHAIERAQAAKRAAEEKQAQASTFVQDAIATLKKAGMSMRDTGQLLGLSHQRVHQLAGASPARKARS